MALAKGKFYRENTTRFSNNMDRGIIRGRQRDKEVSRRITITGQGKLWFVPELTEK